MTSFTNKPILNIFKQHFKVSPKIAMASENPSMAPTKTNFAVNFFIIFSMIKEKMEHEKAYKAMPQQPKRIP